MDWAAEYRVTEYGPQTVYRPEADLLNLDQTSVTSLNSILGKTY